MMFNELCQQISKLTNDLNKQKEKISNLEKAASKIQPKVSDFNDIDGKIVDIIR